MKNFLKNKRKSLGYTLEEMSRKLFVDKSTVHNYESGKRFPSAIMLHSLKQAYELSNDELAEWLEFINENN